MILRVLIFMYFFSFGTIAATFHPITVADLIADIDTSNANNEDDIIDLKGCIFTLTASNNTTDGKNGLPSILSDDNHSLLIKNGTIERNSADNFRLIHIESGGELILKEVILKNGLAAAGGTNGNNGGAIFNKAALSIFKSTFKDNQATSGGGIFNDLLATIFSVNGSSFLDNTATSDGGAICNFATAAIKSINNTDFVNNAAPTGGAIFILQFSIIDSITNSNFNSNSASQGGAINSNGGSIAFIGSTIFSNNQAPTGGALFSNGFIGALIDSQFTYNEATDGAGITNIRSILDIKRCSFSNNTAANRGGAIINFLTGNISLIEDSTFNNNNANIGGAILHTTSVIGRISNSTFSGNKARDSGGGLNIAGVALIGEFNNNTVTLNDAKNQGGGIFVGPDVQPAAFGTFISNIVATNTADMGPDIFGPITPTASFNLIGTDNGGHGIIDGVNHNQVGTDADPLDPKLGPLADNGGPTLTHALLPKSAAINAGDNPNNLKFDQRGRGFPREEGKKTDVGSYEKCQDKDDDGICDHNDDCPNTLGDFCKIGSGGGGGGGGSSSFVPVAPKPILPPLPGPKVEAVPEAEAIIPGLPPISEAPKAPMTDNASGCSNTNGSEPIMALLLMLLGCSQKAFTTKRSKMLALAIIASSTNAAIFHPITVDDLIADIKIANKNNKDDIIDLGGKTFTLITINNNTDGNNGLPNILSDNNHSLLIKNGTIERNSLNNFRLLHIESKGELILREVTLNNGFETLGGAIFNKGALTIFKSSFTNNQANVAGGGIWNESFATIFDIKNTTFLDNTADSGGAIFNQPKATVVNIDNTKFFSNDSISSGGAIFNSSAASINAITHSQFSENTAARGGGIDNLGHIAFIKKTIISNNTSGSQGGGIFNFTLIGPIEDSQIIDNHSLQADGGGIANLGSIASIVRSTISGNSAARRGGGIHNESQATILLIQDSTISDNMATDDGGGINNNSGLINRISNSTFSDNKTSNFGGGLANNTSGVIGEISNSTFTKNSATNQGGGIFNSAPSATIHIFISNIVAANTANLGPDIFGPITFTASFNLIGTDGGGHGIMNGVNHNQVGTDANPLDPKLGPLADNGGPTLTHALLPNSPAIDAGANPNDLKFDQRGPGFPREQGRQTDVGSFESCFEKLTF